LVPIGRNEGFIHFGWDYYMYIGVPHPCASAQARPIELGLYVEKSASPYNEAPAPNSSASLQTKGTCPAQKLRND
jgi:hypothetical protein